MEEESIVLEDAHHQESMVVDIQEQSSLLTFNSTDMITVANVITEPSNAPSIAALWRQSISSSQGVKSLELADAKYDMFYLSAVKKQALMKAVKLERDVQRAALLCIKDAEMAMKSNKVNVDKIFVKPPVRSRLEGAVDRRLQYYRDDPSVLAELISRTESNHHKLRAEKLNTARNKSLVAQESIVEPSVSISPRSLSPSERSAIVRERRDTIVLEQQRAVEDLISLRILKAEQKSLSDAQRVFLQLVFNAQVVMALQRTVEDIRQQVIERRLQKEKEAVMWQSAIRIQRKWILTWQESITDVLITNRAYNSILSNKILERRQLMIKKQYRLT
jgi:hypothetical protein